jgi:hypothetical protein
MQPKQKPKPATPMLAANVQDSKKYYASKDKSALSPNITARRGKLNAPLRSNPSLPRIEGDTDANKIYANRGSMAQRQAMRRQQREKDSKARPAPGAAYGAAEPGVVRPLLVREKSEVSSAAQRTIELLTSGQRPVIVEMMTYALLQDFRLQIELAVAREQITDAQFMDVHMRVMPKTGTEIAEAALGKVDPNSVPVAAADEESLPTDFDEFVRGDKPAATASPVTPEQTVIAPEAKPVVDDDDDDE